MNARHRKKIKLSLPWPPTVNHYWRMGIVDGKPRIFASAEGIAYRDRVRACCHQQNAGRNAQLGPLNVRIAAFFPDRRKRDIENIQKALLDALGKKGGHVYHDDSQIADLHIWRAGLRKGGCVEITIAPLQIATLEEAEQLAREEAP